MCKLRDAVVFFAGAEFFHTASHIILPYVLNLPLATRFIEVTPTMNLWAIGFNAIITVALLWWASRLH